MSMTLSSAIHKAISDFSPSVLSSNLCNIVADYCGFDDVPAAKSVLKEIVAQGYGEKILALYFSKLPWQKKVQGLASEFKCRTGYESELVDYVFGCMEYGLGWIKDEPSYDVSNRQKGSGPGEDLSGVDLGKQLALMQKEYISMLNSLIVVPKGRLYKKSGYYPAKASSELWVVEHKIDIISAALGQDNSSWCRQEKNKVLARYQVSESAQRTAVFVKAVLPGCLVVLALTIGAMYVSSIPEMRKYDLYISQGDDALTKGEYIDAANAYAAAWKEYDGVFGRVSRRKAATAKFSQAFTSFYESEVARSREFASSGKYAAARETLNALEQYPFDEAMRSSLRNEQNSLEKTIAKAVSDGKETMLTVVSAKGRKLDPQTRKTLDELLKVAPDDYWLNFVKNKSK